MKAMTAPSEESGGEPQIRPGRLVGREGVKAKRAEPAAVQGREGRRAHRGRIHLEHELATGIPGAAQAAHEPGEPVHRKHGGVAAHLDAAHGAARKVFAGGLDLVGKGVEVGGAHGGGRAGDPARLPLRGSMSNGTSMTSDTSPSDIYRPFAAFLSAIQPWVMAMPMELPAAMTTPLLATNFL